MCLLAKALYGHPESGGHWENHFTEAIKKIGGLPIPDHPSSFWFATLQLLLTVYVDDLLLSGPVGNHDKIWNALKEYPIQLGEPEDVNRFLGRNHDVQKN